jgi:hypothetical protein
MKRLNKLPRRALRRLLKLPKPDRYCPQTAAPQRPDLLWCSYRKRFFIAGHMVLRMVGCASSLGWIRSA